MSHRPDKSAHRRSRSDAHARARSRLAQEAARLISAGEAADHAQACRKAAQRLGVLDRTLLPTAAEIDQALREYQRLFRSDAGRLSRRYREAALEAMEFLARFQPKLTGPVLEGTADGHAVVTLHLHHDDPDAVEHQLREHGIPADTGSVHLRLDPHHDGEFPSWRFYAGDAPFELVVLPLQQARQAPLMPGDDRPMRRAGAAQLRRLIHDGDPHTGAAEPAPLPLSRT